jgi:hypothetical protein
MNAPTVNVRDTWKVLDAINFIAANRGNDGEALIKTVRDIFAAYRFALRLRNADPLFVRNWAKAAKDAPSAVADNMTDLAHIIANAHGVPRSGAPKDVFRQILPLFAS